MTRIRKSPTMTGPFAEVAQEFIQYKRSAGFKYADEPKCLSRFCRFSEELGITEIETSRSLAEKWIAPRESESEKSRSHRITCIRPVSYTHLNPIASTLLLPKTILSFSVPRDRLDDPVLCHLTQQRGTSRWLQPKCILNIRSAENGLLAKFFSQFMNMRSGLCCEHIFNVHFLSLIHI